MKALKTVSALLLSSALISSAAVPTFAAQSEKGEMFSAGYTFSPHDYNYDLKNDKVIYTDEFFSFPSKCENPHLASASMAFAAAGIGSTYSVVNRQPEHMADNAKEFLENLGFEKFTTNQDFVSWPKADGSTLGVCGAAKKITVNGKSYTLFAFVPRNANYGCEWAQNMNIGKADENGSEAVGFRLARNRYLEFLKEYISDYYKDNPEAPKDIKIWTTGYSRGGGTVNIAVPYFFAHKDEFLPEDVSVSEDDLYAYTYGTPSAAWAGTENENAEELSSCDYMHNYYLNYDQTTLLAFPEWGFGKYGVNNILNLDFNEETKKDDPEREAEMLSFLKELAPATYDIYTGEGAVPTDPDTFAIYRFKDDGTFLLEPDPENPTGFPEDLGGFLKDRFDRIRSLSDGRDSYTDNYQETVMLLAEFFKGDYSYRADQLVANIAAESDIKTTGAFVVLWYLVDRYMTVKNIDSSDLLANYREQIRASITMAEYMLTEERYKVSLTDEEVEEALALIAAIEENLDVKIETTIPAKLEKLVTALFAGDVCRAAEKSGYTEEEIQRFVGENNKNMIPMLRLVTALLMSSENEKFEIIKIIPEAPYVEINWHCDQLNTLATVVSNGRHFTGTPHKNEIILSWLRVADSYFSDKYNFGAYRTLSVDMPEADAKLAIEYNGNKIALDVNAEGIKRTDEQFTDVNVFTNLVDGKLTITLPFGTEYKVTMTSGQDCTVNSVVNEYTTDGNNAATVTEGKSGRSFSNISLAAGKELVYTLSDRTEEGIVGTAAYDAVYEEQQESSEPASQSSEPGKTSDTSDTEKSSAQPSSTPSTITSPGGTFDTGDNTSSSMLVFVFAVSVSFVSALALVFLKNRSLRKISDDEE